MSQQTELDVGITDTHDELSVDADISVKTEVYKCHRCIKRKRCKDRYPEKARYGDWDKRKECEKFEEDKEWWT